MSVFNGVKVFSATMFAQRRVLGETVTAWLEEQRRQPGFVLVDIVVRQSSDRAFHATTLVVFYRVAPGPGEKASAKKLQEGRR